MRIYEGADCAVLKIIDRYGHVHNCKEFNVVIVARRLSIANTRWW